MKIPNTRSAVEALILLLLIMPLGVTAQTAPKKLDSKHGNSDLQMQLRFRLQANPHDKNARDELIKLLSAKYAFRPEMEEDGTWLKNNPDDYVTEIEMRSLATTAVDDPEYANSIDRFILSHANRADAPKSYDFVSDRLAFGLLDRDHDTEALKLLRLATIETPNDAGVWENLGDAQVRIGHPDEALVSYRKSIDLDPTQEDPHEGLANALFKLDRYGESELELKAAMSIYRAQYHGVPTDTFHLMMKNMEQATHSEPGLADLYFQLARIYVAERKFDEALAQIAAASKANPGDKITYEYLRAAIYDQAAQPKNARMSRLRASGEVQEELKKEPRSTGMDAILAYPQIMFMSIEGDDEDSAHEVVKFLEPLASHGTLKAMDLTTLGFAYCTLGRAADCNSRVEAGLRKDEKLNNAKSQHNLAEALLKAHDSSGAFEHFRKAYEFDPQNMTYRMDYESMMRQVGDAGSH